MASFVSSVTSNTSSSSIYGNRNVISGLASGMDTESMIENAVSGIKMKVTELQKDKTKVEWEQSALRDIIDKLAEEEGLEIDNVTEALDRAVEDGITTLVVQPTHLMDGLEYSDVVNEVAAYADSFEKVVMGEPLLTSDEDYDAVIAAITEATSEYDDGETAICFMGHGTEAESNQVYATLQDKLAEQGYENYYVGTVEAEPTLEDVLAAVGQGDYTKAVLAPLMVVAGDHANNDMAGDEEGSWKTEFEGAGYEVQCLIQGLGQLEAIQDIYVAHTQAAVDSLAQ